MRWLALASALAFGAGCLAATYLGIGGYLVPGQEWGSLKGVGFIPLVFIGQDVVGNLATFTFRIEPGEKSEIGWPTSYTLTGDFGYLFTLVQPVADLRLLLGPTFSLSATIQEGEANASLSGMWGFTGLAFGTFGHWYLGLGFSLVRLSGIAPFITMGVIF